MDSPEYALRVFESHYARYVEVNGRPPRTILEVGPGASLMSAVIAAVHGVERAYLVDVGRFAAEDEDLYRKLNRLLRDKGHAAPDLPRPSTTTAMLRSSRGEYLTNGLASLRSLPSHSVDLIWSQAVMEHVRKSDFMDTLLEMRRLLTDDGIASHTVDLEDHLAGSLHNLEFPDRVWESSFMVRSGFYTNRIRYQEMLDMFRDAGFAIDLPEVRRWPALPLRRQRLRQPYRMLPDDDLLVMGFDVVLRPDKSQG